MRLKIFEFVKLCDYRLSEMVDGLFRSSNGSCINADMNGSYNILRKVAGNDIFVYNDISDLVEGYAVSPSRVTF